MPVSQRDLARLGDLARLQRLREDAAAATLAAAQAAERAAQLRVAEAERDAAQAGGEFRAFLAAGRFEPGQYQLFGELLADHARVVTVARDGLDQAREQTAQDQAAHALARLQTRQISQRLRHQQARHHRQAEERRASDHRDLHLILQGGARA